MIAEDQPPSCRNTQLEMLLGRAGWTTAQLATRLNEMARSLGISGHVNQLTPRRWVFDPLIGRPRRPHAPWPMLVPVLLSAQLGEQVTPESLGWPNTDPLMLVPTSHGLNDEWTAKAALAGLARVIDPDPMERRQFFALTGISLTAVAHLWLLDPRRVAASLSGDRVTDAVVDDLARRAAALRRVDDTMGGGALLPSVREDLRLVAAVLKNAAYTEDVGKRLYALAGELGQLAGWLAHDSGQPELAQRYYLSALQCAHVSGDRGIGAHILGFMAIQAEHSAQPADAVTILHSALQQERELTPAVAGSLHGHLASSAARVGDKTTAGRAQNRAFELLGLVDPSNEPSWIYWFDRAEAESRAGSANLTLGKHAEAGDHFRRALAHLSPDFSRDRAHLMCDLALARLGSGAVDHACATGSEAATIVRRLNSKRSQERLAEFRAKLTPYRNSAAVRDFDAKHGDLVTTTRV